MYISVGVNLSNSKIPQKEGITDYGLFSMKKLFHRCGKKTQKKPEIYLQFFGNWENPQFPYIHLLIYSNI